MANSTRWLKLSASASAVAIALGAGGTAFANEDVLTLQADPANAVMPSINYWGWNYSELDQINLANVAELQLAWTWQVGIMDSHEAPPLVVGDTMYIASPKPNYIYALDLNADGVIKWEFRPDMNVELATQQTCCGGQTRGLYYAEGKVFYATLDGQVFGLDAATGEALWRTVGTNISYGEGMPSTGIVVDNLFITGNEGGERGARGKVMAFDINTGNLQWTMYSMGPDNEVGITPAYRAVYADNQTSLTTWYGDSWRRGGGTVWGYYTYNEATNIFHYSTGNCGPWNADYRREWGIVNLDENGGMIDYQNNWCASELARDATTGNLVWAFNMTPADPWDQDHPNITPLMELSIGGETRMTAVKASANSYFFVWDEATGEMLMEPWMFVYNDALTGVDMETGRMLIAIDKWPFTHVEDRRRYTQADPGRRADGTTVADYTGTEVGWCPGTKARYWENDAYSPRTGLLYTATNTDCRTLVAMEGEYVPGQGYNLTRTAGTYPWYDMDGVTILRHPSEVQANSPTESRTVWRIIQTTRSDQPLMATAGDLLFQGAEGDGMMNAYDATNGELAWQFRTGARFNATPITYLGPDGRQYVAILASSAAANGAVTATAAPDDANRYRRSGSTLYVWGLPQSIAAN